MSAGRSAHGRRETPSEHSGPSCLNCARLEGENRALRITLDNLIARAMPNPASAATPPSAVAPVVSHAGPAETTQIPKAVQLAIVRQFPARTRERAQQEAMARDLIDAGESADSVAQMISNGRPIDL